MSIIAVNKISGVTIGRVAADSRAEGVYPKNLKIVKKFFWGCTIL
jgi:hypothetical protein